MKIEIAGFRRVPDLALSDPGDLDLYRWMQNPWEKFVVPSDILKQSLASRSWESRPRLSTEGDKLLLVSEVLRDALARFGGEISPAARASYGEADSVFGDLISPILCASAGETPAPVKMLVDSFGRVSWEFNADDVRIGDLERLADAGLLQGDPHRLYLNLDPAPGAPLGGNGYSLWVSALAVLDVATAWVNQYGGAAALAIELGREVMRRHAGRWERRKGGIRQVDELARLAGAESLALRLGIDESDAQALLRCLGYATVAGPVDESVRRTLRKITVIASVATDYYLPEEELERVVTGCMAIENYTDDADLELRARRLFEEGRRFWQSGLT